MTRRPAEGPSGSTSDSGQVITVRDGAPVAGAQITFFGVAPTALGGPSRETARKGWVGE